MLGLDFASKQHQTTVKIQWMNRRKNRSFFPGFVMIPLAWLGLAGMSDAIVTWQAWFDQGVMQHWRSVKEWLIAILLWWVPFQIPSWILDYFVIGAIVLRTSNAPRWNENWRVGPEQVQKMYGYIPLTWKLEWIMSHTVTLHRLPAIVLNFIFWPITILGLSIEAIRGEAFAQEIKVPASVRRREMIAWQSRIAWCFLSFIPFLFLFSTVLYEHG
ncbi:hypothetical protein M3N55_13580 [Roseibaca sp. V10]|uniref:Uncharacterized protein n=1 Tax=Roseinatronobacter domitianus TaxID=2940293 RepID=A0ABT0M4H8_9RHOB|nr:hypothetical protein [Roseibaca domitiana]MCL1629763.1 hypothetical protein [Roseibaca domitiana]